MNSCSFCGFKSVSLQNGGCVTCGCRDTKKKSSKSNIKKGKGTRKTEKRRARYNNKKSHIHKRGHKHTHKRKRGHKKSKRNHKK